MRIPQIFTLIPFRSQLRDAGRINLFRIVRSLGLNRAVEIKKTAVLCFWDIRCHLKNPHLKGSCVFIIFLVVVFLLSFFSIYLKAIF